MCDSFRSKGMSNIQDCDVWKVDKRGGGGGKRKKFLRKLYNGQNPRKEMYNEAR